ncbi:MAG TPA: ABC transporter substrate-binding protein [Candidatus Binatia bacterium]
MRRSLLSLLFFFFLCAPPLFAQSKIVVGLSSVNIAFLPVYVAQERGFFRDEGLDVIFVMFNAGSTNLQALMGGDVQVMGSAFVETIGGRAAGFDIKNFWGISNLMPFELYSHPNFKSMKDAKGKKFAISRFGSLTDYLTRATLQHFGVHPKEVTILQIGSTPARFAALAAGSVDASIVWFPVTDIAKAQGYNRLYDLKGIFPEWPYETFAARESWLAREKDQVVKFLRAYQRGVKHTLENKADAVKAIRQYVKIDPAYAPRGYDEYRNSFPMSGAIADKAIPAVIEDQFEAGMIKRKFPVDDLIDKSFMKILGGK